MEKQTKKEIKIIEMAKKRRHIYLLEKMQRGKSETPALSKSEIKELQSFELPSGSPAVVNTQEEVAKIFGVTVRTIQYWAREGMPVTPEGTYDLIEIRAWRIVRTKRDKNGSGNGKINWEQKYREYKARLAEIELKKALKEYVPIEDVCRELIACCTVIKRKMLCLPDQVAPQLTGFTARQAHAFLLGKIKEVLDELAHLDIEIYGKNKIGIVIKSIEDTHEKEKE